MTPKTSDISTSDTSQSQPGVLAKLRAHREAQSGDETFTLARTGVVVTYPQFRAYEQWARAQQLAGADAAMINLYYIVAVCRFDGEQLKAGDYRELIPADDHLAISNKLFGGAQSTDSGKD